MTEKLYDMDSHLRAFTATVRRCEPAEGGFRVFLDRTAFFPEGGGQPADTGTLGGAAVLDVQEEACEIVHYTTCALETGAQVQGEIHWPQRFRRMQGHSGEHIISGIVHRKYGYDNVGFHLGDHEITMDYNGELTWAQLMEIERLANEAVWRNVPVRAEYPSQEALAAMEYRSKLELKENVRIVTVEGYDVCACCAPHVSFTGEIGAIKIVDSMRHRGGVRLTILCGSDAQADYQRKHEQIAAISAKLSARQSGVVDAVVRLQDEIAALKQTIFDLNQKLNEQRLQTLPETSGSLCIVDVFDDMPAMRELVNAGMQRAGGVCAAFSGTDETGYRYIIGSLHTDLRARAGEINAALSGKGGGQSTMIQGSCTAARAVIEAFFEQFEI